MWQAALYALVLAIAGFLTVRSRKDEKPEYAAKRVESANGNGNGNGYSAAIAAEGKRLDMLDRRVDRLEADLKAEIAEQSEAILTAISRAQLEANARFGMQSDLIVGLRKDVDRLLSSQTGNGAKHG